MAVLYSQAVLHTLAAVEIPAVDILAVDRLDNWTVVKDNQTRGNQAEVNVRQVDMELGCNHLTVQLQNQAVEVHHSWMELEMN